MRFFIFLALAVAAVASMPLDQKNDAELALISGKIVIKGEDPENGKWRHEIRFRRDTEDGPREISLADLSPADLANMELLLKTTTVGFVEMEDAEVLPELAGSNGEVWIRAGGGSRGGSVHVGGRIRFNQEELTKLVDEELEKLGLTAEQRSGLNTVVEVVEVEALPQLTKSNGEVWIRAGGGSRGGSVHVGGRIRFNGEQEAEQAGDLPMDYKKGGKKRSFELNLGIKLRLRYTMAQDFETADAQLARGSIWIRGEGGSRGGSVHVGGSIRFHAEQMTIEEAGVRPTAQLAGGEVWVKVGGGNGGNSIHVGGTIRFNGQEFHSHEEAMKVRGGISGSVRFADLEAAKEVAAQLAEESRGSIWVRGEGGSRGGSIHVGGTIRFNHDDLISLMKEELEKLGLECGRHLLEIDGPIEIDGVEIRSKKELEKLTPEELFKLRVKIHGKINAGIKFINPEEAKLAEGNVWVRAEGSNKGGSVHVGGTITFNAEQLDGFQLEDVEIVPIAQLAGGEVWVKAGGGSGGGSIHVGGTIRFNGQEFHSHEEAMKVRGGISGSVRFADLEAAKEVAAQLAEESRGSIWVRGEGGSRGGSIHVGGTIRFNHDDLISLMKEELEKLGLECGRHLLEIEGPIEIDGVEIGSKKALEKLTPEELLKLRVKIHGKINAGIKFINPEDAKLAEGNVWVRAEGSNKGGSVHVGGTITFSAVELEGFKLENVQLVPIAQVADGEVWVKAGGGSGGGSIHVGGTIRFNNEELDSDHWGLRVKSNVIGTMSFADLESAQEVAAELAKGTIWIQGSGGRGRVRIGGSMRFSREGLIDEILRELEKLGIQCERHVIHIIGPIELEDAEVLTEEQLQNLTPEELFKLRLKVRGNINVGIKFVNPTDPQLAEGNVWVRAEGSNKGGSVHVGGTITFNAEQLDGFQLEDVEIVPIAQLAGGEIWVKGGGGSGGGSIHVGGTIRF